MKYIISESRLNKLMDIFLDSIFKPYSLLTIDIGYRPYLVVNDRVVGVLGKNNNLLIDEDVVNSFMITFSLSNDDALEKIEFYLSKNLDFDFEVLDATDILKLSQYAYDKKKKEFEA